MIGKLSGRVDYKAIDHVMLDVRGVGYMVYCSDRTLAVLPPAGEAVALYTDLLVREDLMQLFGFTSLVEKEWHRMLMSVQGIGAKASLAILGALGPDGVSRSIAMGDWTALKAAKGVGPKTAQRVVIELKDKAPTVMAMMDGEAQIHADDMQQSRCDRARRAGCSRNTRKRRDPFRAGRCFVGAEQFRLCARRGGGGCGAAER